MAASEGDHGWMLGVWRLVSAQVRYEDTDEVHDLHGPDPRGFITFNSEGRVAVITTASGRKSPKDDAEAAALFPDMSAYTGRFTVAWNRVITEVDAAWHPAWEDSQQPRFHELEGNRLTLKTEVQDHPAHPSRQLQGIVVWTRDR
jgi:hypothetical protein